MGLDAGKLRHRVSIERQSFEQDSNGHTTPIWELVAESVPAAIEPLSAREFLAARTEKSQVTARITIRFREGIVASMRLLHGSRIYNIEGVLPDKDSGRDYLTLPCSEGVNEG